MIGVFFNDRCVVNSMIGDKCNGRLSISWGRNGADVSECADHDCLSQTIGMFLLLRAVSGQLRFAGSHVSCLAIWERHFRAQALNSLCYQSTPFSPALLIVVRDQLNAHDCSEAKIINRKNQSSLY